MSDALKWDLAHELGVTDIVSREGWGGVSARNCGNLVKLAIQRAEEAMAGDYAERQALGVRAPEPRRAQLGGFAGQYGLDVGGAKAFRGQFRYWAGEQEPWQPEQLRG